MGADQDTCPHGLRAVVERTPDGWLNVTGGTYGELDPRSGQPCQLCLASPPLSSRYKRNLGSLSVQEQKTPSVTPHPDAPYVLGPENAPKKAPPVPQEVKNYFAQREWELDEARAAERGVQEPFRGGGL